MNLSQQIRAYLNDGYYAQGVSLLSQLSGISSRQLSQFQAYLDCRFVPGHVEEELQELLWPYAAEEVRVGEEPVKKKKKVSGSFWGALFEGKEEIPAAIWELYESAKRLHKERDRLHPLIVEAARNGEEKKAYDLAKRLMEEIIPALDTKYDAARAWDEKGELPGAILRNQVVQETVEKMHRIKYCTERMSRLRGILKNGSHKRKKKLVAITLTERQAYEKELLELELERKKLTEELGL